MSVIENLAVLSNLELFKVELLAEKSKSVFDDIFPGLHGDNFGEKALDLEDLEEQMKNVFWVLGGGKGYFRHPSRLF